MLNQTTVRYGENEVYHSSPATKEIPPSAGMPFIQVDNG